MVYTIHGHGVHRKHKSSVTIFCCAHAACRNLAVCKRIAHIVFGLSAYANRYNMRFISINPFFALGNFIVSVLVLDDRNKNNRTSSVRTDVFHYNTSVQYRLSPVFEHIRSILQQRECFIIIPIIIIEAQGDGSVRCVRILSYIHILATISVLQLGCAHHAIDLHIKRFVHIVSKNVRWIGVHIVYHLLLRTVEDSHIFVSSRY